MDKHKADSLQNAWYAKQRDYEELADELHGLLDRDDRFPPNSFYAVKHRIKGTKRFLEKCEKAEAEGTTISPENFESHVNDLLGMRIVCLRPDDIKRVEGYIDLLIKEGQIELLTEPSRRQSFSITPTDDLTKIGRIKFETSGYSSIHYQVKLGSSHRTRRSSSRQINAELQIRNIFEEAWSEVDHKYRYQITRLGNRVPNGVNEGFFSLALYLAGAAYQAEYLCQLIEADGAAKKGPPESQEPPPKPPSDTSYGSAANAPGEVPGPADAPAHHATAQPSQHIPLMFMQSQFGSVFGVTLELRTLDHCIRRFEEHTRINDIQLTRDYVTSVLSNQTAKDEFLSLYSDTLGKKPFGPDSPDLDAINYVNFVLFRTRYDLNQVRRRLEEKLLQRANRRPSGEADGEA